MVCPETVTRHSQDGSWLGIPWVPGSSLSFPRTHSLATCTPVHDVLHLGGRFFLSTKQQQVMLTTGPLPMSPLAIYHIPCNATSDNLPTGFGTCPSTLTITLPIFRRHRVHFIPWTPQENNSTLRLHYKSLSIPPSLHFNKTITTALDNTYTRLDGHFAIQLRKVQADIKKIHTVTNTSTAVILASLALGLTAINIIVLMTLCYYQQRLQRQNHNPQLVHYIKNTRPHPPHFKEQEETEPLKHSDNCPDCGNSPELRPELIISDSNNAISDTEPDQSNPR